MQLTRYSDYSLRSLTYLALNRHRLVTVPEIASAYGISRAHLMKVIQHLGQLGYVETQRGRGGGLGLGMDPSAIRIGDLVLRTEERFQLAECFSPGTQSCTIQAACRLRDVLQEALDAFIAALNRYTLQDLLKNRRGLVQLLRLP